MLVLLAPGTAAAAQSELTTLLRTHSLAVTPRKGVSTTVLETKGVVTPALAAQLRALPHVIDVIGDQPLYKKASINAKPEPSEVRVKGTPVGNGAFALIAGPCAVESHDQLLETALGVQASGVSILRGGAFKPRTSPYSFQGLGEEGLRLLADISRITGMSTVTEVLEPANVSVAVEYVDALQIGARNMQNYPLLRECGRARIPVFLKRGLCATIDEFLLAAEYVLAGGNENVILVERGIRTFETGTRFTLDLAAVPLVKSRTHLPVVVDPSHAAGRASLVAPLARAAAAIGADGLMVEVHRRPLESTSDAEQALSIPEFAALAGDCRAIAELIRARALPAGREASRA